MTQRRLTVPLVAVVHAGYFRSGKGTLIAKFRDIGHPVFETGEELRKRAKLHPNDPTYDPIRKRQPVTSGLVLRVTKLWLIDIIRRKVDREIIHLDGIPRLPDQIPIIEFLQERGYQVKIAWNTTPMEVCEARPPRPNRPEDVDPELIKNGREFYRDQTLPTLHMLEQQFAGAGKKHDVLKFNNAELQPEESFSLVTNFIIAGPKAAHAAPPVTVQSASTLTSLDTNHKSPGIPMHGQVYPPQ